MSDSESSEVSDFEDDYLKPCGFLLNIAYNLFSLAVYTRSLLSFLPLGGEIVGLRAGIFVTFAC